MTAKEMFGEIDFRLYFDNDRFLSYEGKYETYDCYIVFDKSRKGFYGFVFKNGEKRLMGLQVQELQAINKQVEELGWK